MSRINGEWPEIHPDELGFCLSGLVLPFMVSIARSKVQKIPHACCEMAYLIYNRE